MKSENTKSFIQGFAIAVSLIAGIIAIVNFLKFDISSILDSTFIKPIIILFLLVYPFLFGFILARYLGLSKFKKDENREENLEVKFIQEVIERELKAKIIWIVIKRLNYDINHPKYIEAIKTNLRNGVKYRYIVNKDEHTDADLLFYKELYQLSDSQLQESFLILENSEMIKFLRHITIYDPHSNETVSYFYSHSGEDENERKYVIFNNRKSMEYVSIFKSIWLRYKSVMP